MTEDEFYERYGKLKKLPLSSLEIPAEQRDVIENHKGFLVSIVPGLVGTLTALYDPATDTYWLVDGYQRYAKLKDEFGADFKVLVHIPGEDYTPERVLYYFLALNAGRVQVSPYYYWRAKLRTEGSYPGIKALDEAATSVGWKVGPKPTTSPESAPTYVAVYDLCSFAGLDLKGFSRDDAERGITPLTRQALSRAMALSAELWLSDPENRKALHGAEVILGLARVLRDAKTIKGKRPDEAEIRAAFKSANVGAADIVGRAASQVKDAVNQDGTPRLLGSSHGGHNEGWLGARYVLMLLNGDYFEFKDHKVQLRTRRIAKTKRYHLPTDKAYKEAMEASVK